MRWQCYPRIRAWATLAPHPQKAFLTGASILVAIVAMLIIAKIFRADYQAWNAACGAQIQIYPTSYSWILSDPLYVIGFVMLTLPAILTRSNPAHQASLIVTLVLLFWLALLALHGVAAHAYDGNCYEGGGPNSPGQVVFVIMPSVALITLLNSLILGADWITGIVRWVLMAIRSG